MTTGIKSVQSIEDLAIWPDPGSECLDYEKVHRYWNHVKPSVMGPYMMDGFGIPVGAGHFRFQEECKIVDPYIKNLDSDLSVLDLGSGVGFWSEYFAKRFSKVVSVEASNSLYKNLQDRCNKYSNIDTVHCNVMSFEPHEKFGIIFLGGLLMYLNETEVKTLLENLVTWLEPGGLIICRESTVRNKLVIRQGNYQAIYRSVQLYNRIFKFCGLKVIKEESNIAYIGAQMSCELVKKWKSLVPQRLWILPIFGAISYGFFRFGYPLNAKYFPSFLERFGIKFPHLTNHFFVLTPQKMK